MIPRAGLSRERIVRVAAELYDQADGQDIPLKTVAEKLGVRTPSLYNHIAGQDALQQELAVYGVRELEQVITRAAVGKSGDDAVRAVANSYRTFAHRHPGIYRLTQRAPAPDDVALQAASADLLQVLHLILQSYGLGETGEINAIRAMRSLVHGFVSLELAGGFGLPVDIDKSFQWLIEMFIQGLARVDHSGAERKM